MGQNPLFTELMKYNQIVRAPLQFNPIWSKPFTVKGPGEVFRDSLKISATYNASLMESFTAIVLLKAYQNI